MSDAGVAALSGIIVAGITIGVPLIVAAFNTRKIVVQAKDNAEAAATAVGEVKETLGESNGNGNMNQMIAKVLAWQAEQSKAQDKALAALRNQEAEFSAYTHDRNHLILNILTALIGKTDLMWHAYCEEHGIEYVATDMSKLPYPDLGTSPSPWQSPPPSR